MTEFNRGETHYLYEVIEVNKAAEPWMKPLKVGDILGPKDKFENNRRQILNEAGTDIVTVERFRYHGRIVRPTKDELTAKLHELKEKVQKRREREKEKKKMCAVKGRPD